MDSGVDCKYFDFAAKKQLFLGRNKFNENKENRCASN
jgi:hypothetical protein